MGSAQTNRGWHLLYLITALGDRSQLRSCGKIPFALAEFQHRL